MDPYVKLGAAIIRQAADDLKDCNRKIEKCRDRIKEYEMSRDYRLESEEEELRFLKGEKRELIRFFESQWCEGLCDLVGINVAYITNEIKNRNFTGKKSVNTKKAL